MPTDTAATCPWIGIARDLAGLDELRGRQRQRDVAAGDRCRARAAVGLQDVAVDRDGVLAERVASTTARKLRPISRWISSVRPLCGRARPRAGERRVRRARQHAVLGRHPALRLALQEWRHLGFDRRRAQHARIAELGEHRSFGMAREVRRQLHVAHFVAAPSTRPHSRLHSSEVSRTAYQLARRSAAALGAAPTHGSNAGVVAVRRVFRDGALGEHANDFVDGRALVADSVGQVGVFEPRTTEPSVQTRRTSPGSSLLRAVTLMSGSGTSPPKQHSTKLRIG